jgi:hypothetical protein
MCTWCATFPNVGTYCVALHILYLMCPMRYPVCHVPHFFHILNTFCAISVYLLCHRHHIYCATLCFQICNFLCSYTLCTLCHASRLSNASATFLTPLLLDSILLSCITYIMWIPFVPYCIILSCCIPQKNLRSQILSYSFHGKNRAIEAYIRTVYQRWHICTKDLLLHTCVLNIPSITYSTSAVPTQLMKCATKYPLITCRILPIKSCTILHMHTPQATNCLLISRHCLLYSLDPQYGDCVQPRVDSYTGLGYTSTHLFAGSPYGRHHKSETS